MTNSVTLCHVKYFWSCSIPQTLWKLKELLQMFCWVTSIVPSWGSLVPREFAFDLWFQICVNAIGERLLDTLKLSNILAHVYCCLSLLISYEWSCIVWAKTYCKSKLWAKGMCTCTCNSFQTTLRNFNHDKSMNLSKWMFVYLCPRSDFYSYPNQ